MNVKRQMECCDEAPFYVLGPIVTRRGSRLRPHITSAIGAAMAAWHGAAHALLRNSQGAPGAAQPGGRSSGRNRLQDCRPRGRRRPASPLGQGPATTPSRRPGWRSTGRSSSAFRWTPKRPGRCTTNRLPEAQHKQSHYCSMCGPKFCSMKTTEEFPADGAGLIGALDRRSGAAQNGILPSSPAFAAHRSVHFTPLPHHLWRTPSMRTTCLALAVMLLIASPASRRRRQRRARTYRAGGQGGVRQPVQR